MDLDEMLPVDICRDIWTNWLTFEHDPDYSPDAGTGLLSPISYKRWYAEFYVGKIPIFIPNMYFTYSAAVGGDPVGISPICLIFIKLEWLGYRYGEETMTKC